MPCNTEIPPNYNDYDKYISETVKNLLFICNELNVFPPKSLTIAYTQSKFSTKDGSYWVNMLCERLKNMSKENLELILNKENSKKSKRLSNWWEAHKKMDKN